jgi:predicted glycosyltransferase
MGRKIRIFLYSQHLSGTGHYVRTYEIARALAEDHDVVMLEGGRPVPRSKSKNTFEALKLPPIYRTQEGIAPLNPESTIEVVLEERKNILRNFISSFRPDVILIEHFPFSKHLLAPEIIPVIRLAREINRNARIVCSVRDIIPRSPRDPEPGLHRQNVLNFLDEYFDAVLVHSDPDLVRLQDHLPWANQIMIPVRYTGYVSEKPFNTYSDNNKTGKNSVLVSAGGAGGIELISQCIRTWERAGVEKIIRDRKLTVFLPLFLKPEDRLRLEQEAGRVRNISLMSFSTGFVDYLVNADLSISQAGYNTCTNLLETRARSILVPDISMSDQLPRAELMAKTGNACMIHPDELTAEKLAQTMVKLFSTPKPGHDIALYGAENTRDILENLYL